MSYEKDKDRYTRGVGAIAALDQGNRSRYRQRVARTRLTNQLDKALSGYTFRPGGGVGRTRKVNLSGLGALNTAGYGKITGHIGSTLNTYNRPDMPTSPTVGPMPSPHGGFTPAPIIDTRPPKLYGGAGTSLQQPSGTLVRGGTVPLTTGGKPVTGYMPPAPMPGSGTAPGSGLATTVAGSSSTVGGGGGGGGGFDVQQPTFPGFETPQTPDIPEDVEASSGGIDLKTVAIVGAAGAALWYLLRKKKGGTP